MTAEAPNRTLQMFRYIYFALSLLPLSVFVLAVFATENYAQVAVGFMLSTSLSGMLLVAGSFLCFLHFTGRESVRGPVIALLVSGAPLAIVPLTYFVFS